MSDEPGRTAYEARFAGETRITPFADLPEEARAIWRRIEAACAVLPPSPDPSRTDELARLSKALAMLTDAFLLRHGCFPNDRTNENQITWNDAMSEAYDLIGQPDTSDRRRKLAAYRSGPPAATPSAPAPGPAEGAQSGDGPQLERVRHRERGAEYEVLGEAEVQISTRSTCPDGVGNGVLPKSTIIREGRAGYESDRLVVYRCVKTGKLWCRLPDEFRDGRFESLDRCIACEEVIRDGDLVLPDAEGGYIHRACCGPERESFTGADGEPLKDGAPIPEGRPYRAEIERLDRRSPPTAQAEQEG